MAEGKIRDKNHIIETRSLLFLQNLLPDEWVQRKMDPDYGIDLDLELFDYEKNVCVTLGEHIFLQVKGTEALKYATIKPVGKQIYTKKELDKMQVPVLKFVVDVSLMKLVERMGSAIPVLLIVVDITSQIAYYICLNDYVRNVLLYRSSNYRNQDTWSASSNEIDGHFANKFTLTGSGTYRATFTLTVTGNDGTVDTIPIEIEDSY